MARGHIQRKSTEPHPDRPSVSLRLDRSTKERLDAIAADEETSAAALMETFICDGINDRAGEDDESVEAPDASLRAARAVAVKVKVRVAKALGAIVKSIEQELT